ncbi:MAG: transporter substrate-binding protein [Ramlibacter sp.]|nr:transporter substrate-binding protein [Ramlibacter sp.]
MKSIFKLIVLAALALSSAAALAQFPTPGKPITIVNPYPPGGLGDLLARAMARQMTESLGTPVVVESRPGANGAIGITYVARSQPDGYTLGSVPMSTLAINPVIYKGLTYQPKDLTPITQAVTFSNVLVANIDVPVGSLKDLPGYLRDKSADLNFASQGNGSSGHLEGALLNLSTGAHVTHVPYQGSGPAMQDLLSGKVQFMFETVPAAMPFIKSGRLKALGIASAAALPGSPDIPPISSVIKGFEATNWIGVVGPAGMPADVVAKLNEHIVRALKSPEMARLAEERSVVIVGSKPEELARVIAADTKKWTEVVRDARIKLD